MHKYDAKSSLSDGINPNLPAELQAHLPVAEQAAANNLARVIAKHKPLLLELLQQARITQTPKVPSSTKLIRLRYIASEYTNLFAKETACASGCSHCCNIDTAVSRSEAKLIAKAIKRPFTEPAARHDILTSSERKEYWGVPCTFLIEGKCSIYAHRPLVCRTLVNMDKTDKLCKLIPESPVPVPYLNTAQIQGVFASITMNEQYADVREWFPSFADKR